MRKYIMVVITAVLCTAFLLCFRSGIRNEFPLVIAKEAVNNEAWAFAGQEQVSKTAVKMNLKYKEKLAAHLLVGVKYTSGYFSPEKWRRFTSFPIELSRREIITVGGHPYKWLVNVSKPDPVMKRDMTLTTYLIGGRSCYTFNGAGLTRFIFAARGRGVFPYVLVKLHVPEISSPEEAKEITDSFMCGVVPGLRDWLSAHFPARYISRGH